MKKINKKSALIILIAALVVFGTSCASSSGKYACPEKIGINLIPNFK